MKEDFDYFNIAHDKMLAARLSARSTFEAYIYNIRNAIEKLKQRLSVVDKIDLQNALEEAKSWLDASHEVSAEEYQAEQEHLHTICSTICQRLKHTSDILQNIASS